MFAEAGLVLTMTIEAASGPTDSSRTINCLNLDFTVVPPIRRPVKKSVTIQTTLRGADHESRTQPHRNFRRPKLRSERAVPDNRRVLRQGSNRLGGARRA